MAVDNGVRLVVGRPKGRRTTAVQSVLFDADQYSTAQAKRWLRDYGLKVPHRFESPDTGNYYRARQASPGTFQKGSFRTISPGKRLRRKSNAPTPAKDGQATVSSSSFPVARRNGRGAVGAPKTNPKHENYRLVVRRRDKKLFWFAGHEMTKNRGRAVIYHSYDQAVKTKMALEKRLRTQVFIDIESSRSKNPAARKSTKIARAAKLFSDFTGHHAENVDSVRLALPDVGMMVGECDGILYSTIRDGKAEQYVHHFKDAARPTLAVSHDGKQLLLVGGDYTFTERGIVDGR